MKALNRLVVVGCLAVASAMPGCVQGPTMPQARKALVGMSKDMAMTFLMQHVPSALRVRTIGDLIDQEGIAGAENSPGIPLEAESIVVNLPEGHGSKKEVPSALRSELMKLLMNEYEGINEASRVLTSGTAAPVRVRALLPVFPQAGEKIDVVVQAYDDAVTLDGGVLVTTPLSQWERPASGTARWGFATKGGLMKGATRADARGTVTLNPGYRNGEPLGKIIPTLGYLPAGAKVRQEVGYQIFLKSPDAYAALLVEVLINQRFAPSGANATPVVYAPNTGVVFVSLPAQYTDNWKRYLDVLVQIDIREGTPEQTLAHVAELIQALRTGDDRVRYRTECELEAVGLVASPALLEAARAGTVEQRRSAIRVLCFMQDTRVVPTLIEESRTARGPFRIESARLMGFFDTKEVSARLVEMLTDEEVRARCWALVELAKFKYPGIQHYPSKEKNFEMFFIDVGGPRATFIKSLSGIRHIVMFGQGIRFIPPFHANAGPVEVSVGPLVTELRLKNKPGSEPLQLPTQDVRDIVRVLDTVGVSINDIIGLISESDRKKALSSQLYWVD